MIVDAQPLVNQVIGPGSPRYRYPGAPPFEDSDLDRRLFRGRAEEADTVLHTILCSKLFLLYAESGLGKTSLLKAGVMHELRGRGHWPVVMRLNDIGRSPTAQIREQIEEAAASETAIDVVFDAALASAAGTDASLWDLLGSLAVWRGNDPQTPVVIFDQFEELFTLEWDETVRRQFIVEFGEIVRGHRDQPPATAVPPPDVNFVLVIREDSLGELEVLSADVPQILRNRFRLGGLAPASAESSIREPGLLEDDRLDSQRFEYTEAAAAEILNFLRKKARTSTGLTATVDPSQLQIVCQYVERAIVPRKATGREADAVVQIDAPDLGGKAGLDHILTEFYRRTIERFPAAQRRRVRKLCERGLISQSERRLSVDQGEIRADYGVTSTMLQALVDGRLLRTEPRLESVYYELAHDTLVPAILAERHNRRRRRRKALVAALGVVLLVVAILAGLALVLGSDNEPQSQSIILSRLVPTEQQLPSAPNVTGESRQAAVEELESLGMAARVVEVNSERAIDEVLSQDPGAGESVENATVVLQVSIGQAFILRDDSIVTTPGQVEIVDVLKNDDANGSSSMLVLLPELEVDDGITAEVADGVVRLRTDAAGTYTVAYQVREGAPGQRGTLTVTAEEFEAVILSAPRSAVVGEEVTFVDDSRGAIVARTWDFGDGAPPADGQSVTHTYAESGSYEVTLSISDGRDNVTSTTSAIDVVDPPELTALEWPYGDFFAVQQLGVEPVRGTGCGGDGQMGDQIPDGIWFGYLSDIDRSTGRLMIDLVCVFYDERADELIEANIGVGPADFYVVNNSDRKRAVDLNPDFIHHDAVRVDDGCLDPGPGADPAGDRHEQVESWLIIQDNAAVFALTSCAES